MFRLASIFGLLACIVLSQVMVSADEVSEIFVCSSPDESFLGKYTPGNSIDGTPSFVNENDMAFFRHNKFWYLGDLHQWPPVTHYRCVDYEGCNAGKEIPADNSAGKWVVNKRFGKEPIPSISFTPCDMNDEL